MNLEKVLSSFDKTKESFGYNEANRHSRRFVISPMIKEDNITKEEMEKRYNDDVGYGASEYGKAASGLRDEVGKNEWHALRQQFKHGSAKTAVFIGDDEEEEVVTSNRFTKGINIKQELEQVRKRKAEEEAATRKLNFEQNRCEWQHMDYNTSRADRATRKVIKERKRPENLEKDYNRDYETGNTHKITKERSIAENEAIIKRNDKTGSGRNVFGIRTTLVAGRDGDSIERSDLMNDKNVSASFSDTADAGEYKDFINSA